jgi:hypothetical protein
LSPICYLVERVADNRDEQLVVSAAYGVHRKTDSLAPLPFWKNFTPNKITPGQS